MDTLLPKQRRFVNEYCVDENATQAAIRAGYSENGAGQTAHKLLKSAEIRAAIAERMAELATAAGITPEWVVSQWAKIAAADPNDLMQLRRVCCRHCYGADHAYQWTENEYREAVTKAIENNKPSPDGLGGFGYDMNLPPAEDCPECHGLGHEYLHVADTRHLKGAARKLYAGAQKTRDGLKILTRDQDAAVLNLARYLGMMIDKKELAGPGGGAIPLATIKAEDLSDDQLAAFLKVTDDHAD